MEIKPEANSNSFSLGTIELRLPIKSPKDVYILGRVEGLTRAIKKDDGKIVIYFPAYFDWELEKVIIEYFKNTKEDTVEVVFDNKTRRLVFEKYIDDNGEYFYRAPGKDNPLANITPEYILKSGFREKNDKLLVIQQGCTYFCYTITILGFAMSHFIWCEEISQGAYAESPLTQASLAMFDGFYFGDDRSKQLFPYFYKKALESSEAVPNPIIKFLTFPLDVRELDNLLGKLTLAKTNFISIEKFLSGNFPKGEVYIVSGYKILEANFMDVIGRDIKLLYVDKDGKLKIKFESITPLRKCRIFDALLDKYKLEPEEDVEEFQYEA